MTPITSILTHLLEAAADNVEGAQAKFFATLLESNVFIPLKSGIQAPKSIPKIGDGEDHLSEMGFATIEYQGSSTLPIFSEEHFVHEWAEGETNVSEQSFQKLLWLLGPDSWLYLNPAQEVGKELTPWEIERLKKGPNAIPELVAALNEDAADNDFIVSPADSAFSDLKNKLLPILQIYPELREAFLVTLQESPESDLKPALGIKYLGITEAKRVYLRAEMENASTNYLPGHQQLFLVDDLDNEDSPNWRLFSDSTPFYIAQALSVSQPPGFLQRIKSLFSSKKV